MKRPSLNSSLSNVFTDVPTNSTSAGDINCRWLVDDSVAVKGVKILIYSLVLIVSLFGNSIIVTTVVRNKRMRTTINYLIGNMAASDLLISAIAVPMKLNEIVLGPRRWLIDGIVGLSLCKLAYFFQDISMAVSMLSLVIIAIDRYRGIVFPLRPAVITPQRCKVIIPMIWLISVGLHSPYLYTARLRSHNNTTLCIFDWAPAFDPQKTQEQYIIVIFVLLVLLPFSFLITLYTRIIWILRQKGAEIVPNHLSKRHEENIKVIKNLCAIMVAFALCVFPIFVYAILFYFVWKWKMPCLMEQLGFAAHFVLYSNAAITPVIYFIYNGRYRKGLKDVLRALFFWHKPHFPKEIELNHYL